MPRADLQLRVPLSPHHDVLDVEWTNGDAEALPFEDETFDVILSGELVALAGRCDEGTRSEYLVAVGTLPG